MPKKKQLIAIVVKEVQWERLGEGELYTCKDLTALDFIERVAKVVEDSGIIIKKLTLGTIPIGYEEAE